MQSSEILFPIILFNIFCVIIIAFTMNIIFANVTTFFMGFQISDNIDFYYINLMNEFMKIWKIIMTRGNYSE